MSFLNRRKRTILTANRCSLFTFSLGLWSWIRRGFKPLPPEIQAKLPYYAAQSVLTFVSGWVMLILLVLIMPRLTSISGRTAWVFLLLAAGVYGGWSCLSGLFLFVSLRCEEGQRLLQDKVKK